MSTSDNEKRRQFFAGAGEVRLAGDGTVDEVVAKPVDVHLEQMGHDCWWMGLSTGANDGWRVDVLFTVVDGGINVSVEDVGIEGTGIAVGFVKDDEEDELPTIGHTSMEGPLCSKLLARELIAAARREADEAKKECERLRMTKNEMRAIRDAEVEVRGLHRVCIGEPSVDVAATLRGLLARHDKGGAA
jgi:hypothetical protein